MGREYNLSIVISAKDKASGVLGGLGKNVQTLGTAAIGLGAGAAAGVVALGAGLADMAINAAPLEGIEEAFYGIAEASGESADDMLAALEKGSAGMITQRELMESYNSAAQLVGTTFANELPNAMQYLGKVSAATGEDMGYMMDSLVKGVGRLSPMILDNLGIQVDLNEAMEDWAATSGVAATSVIDNTEAIQEQLDAITKVEAQLKLAAIKQSEWTDKTKESTKAAHAMRVEELAKKLGDYRAELAELEAGHGQVIESTEDLAKNMSKGQQQAALMAQVMEKLGENTAAMPEVVGSAAQGIAALETRFKNLKDRVGMAVLPALTKVLDVLSEGADLIFPLVVPAVESLVSALIPVIEIGGQLVETFTEAIEAGRGVERALRYVVSSMMFLVGISEETQYKIWDIINAAQDLAGKAIAWVSQFVEWKDVLIALGIAIASVVIPAIVSIVAAAAPVIAVGAALVAAVALVRTAWENDWQGIQEKVGAVASFITDVVWPNIQQALDFLTTSVIPPLRAAIEDLWNRASEFWEGFWGAFQPGLEAMYSRLGEFWSEIQPQLMEAWSALNELWNIVREIWETQLQPALDMLTEALGLGGDETSEFGRLVGELAALLVQIQLEALLDALALAIQGFATAMEIVVGIMNTWKDIIDGVKSALEGLSLPDWMNPGSPTPLELGLQGINREMRELSRVVPDWLATQQMGGFSLAGAGGGAGFGGGERMVVLAPIFLDSRDVVSAGGEIDYRAVGQRLRELQGGI